MPPYTYHNGNKQNDYETMLEMMLKFHVPLVTIHKGNTKHIISFGVDTTVTYTFEANELYDVAANHISFPEWVSRTLILSKANDSTITIYNR